MDSAERLTEFRAWLQQNGGYLDPRLVISSDASGLRGLRVAPDAEFGLEKNELAMVVPVRLYLAPLDCPDASCRKIKPLVRLAARLAQDMSAGRNSFYFPYISLLPDRCPHNVDMLSTTERSLLATTVHHVHLSKSALDELDSLQSLMPQFNRSLLKRALCLTRSRSYADERHGKVMVPGHDLMNHAVHEQAPSTFEVRDGANVKMPPTVEVTEYSLILCARWALAPGGELTQTDVETDDLDRFLTFGYVPAQGQSTKVRGNNIEFHLQVGPFPEEQLAKLEDMGCKEPIGLLNLSNETCSSYHLFGQTLRCVRAVYYGAQDMDKAWQSGYLQAGIAPHSSVPRRWLEIDINLTRKLSELFKGSGHSALEAFSWMLHMERELAVYRARRHQGSGTAKMSGQILLHLVRLEWHTRLDCAKALRDLTQLLESKLLTSAV